MHRIQSEFILELHINPEETITEAQANEIALAVKTVAAALEGPKVAKVEISAK